MVLKSKNTNTMTHEINRLFTCSSNDMEREIFMISCKFDTEPLVYVSVYPSKERNIFKRIWKGLKYIFGYTSRYGDSNEFIFNSGDADNLQEVVNYLNKNNVVKK